MKSVCCASHCACPHRSGPRRFSDSINRCHRLPAASRLSPGTPPSADCDGPTRTASCPPSPSIVLVESGELATTASIDQALFKIYADARVSSLEQSLNFAEERAHEAMIGAAGRVEVQEPARQIVQSKSHFAKTARQLLINRLEV